jgi:hypothetical protein
LLVLILSIAAHASTLAEAFPPPVHSERAPADDFGAWLRRLPLHGEARSVRTHDGRVVSHKARVVAMPLVPGDLQQCADSAIRLRAEWQRKTHAPDISFFSTSGDPIPWARYEAGESPYVQDGHIAWRPAKPENQTWDRWLAAVFTWAGTRSLAAYETEAADTPRPGDVLVDPGSPGHTVVILDVAHAGEQTWLLVGEGYMPAQDFHVELGPVDGWWPWTDQGLALPHWPLAADTLRRWR